MADNNSQRTETLYPARGLIYDRNDKLLVDNQAAYDLLIIPDQVKKFDTLELISILDISKEYLEKGIQKCRSYARYKPSILISQITGDKYAILQEKLYRLARVLHPDQNIAEIQREPLRGCFRVY